jgi:hypothetical protein
MSNDLHAVVFTDEQHQKLMELIEQGVLTPTTSYHTVVNEMEFGPLQNTQLPGDTSVVQLGDTHIRVFHPVYDKNFFMSIVDYLDTKLDEQHDPTRCEWSDDDGCFFFRVIRPDGVGFRLKRSIEEVFESIKNLLADPK